MVRLNQYNIVISSSGLFCLFNKADRTAITLRTYELTLRSHQLPPLPPQNLHTPSPSFTLPQRFEPNTPPSTATTHRIHIPKTLPHSAWILGGGASGANRPRDNHSIQSDAGSHHLYKAPVACLLVIRYSTPSPRLTPRRETLEAQKALWEEPE